MWSLKCHLLSSFHFLKNSAVSMVGYQVGADRTNGGREWKGTFGEILAFNSKLSDADRQKIEGYLANKWGINGNLPSTHPYVASMPGYFGNVSLGQTTMGLTGLSPSTTYNIRVQATNSAGSRLSDLVSFTTSSVPTPPALSVSNPTVVGNTTATTKGNLLSFDGTTNPTITLYYGTSDGNQTPANWNGTSSPVSLSTKPVGPLDHNLSGLTAGTTYYYRYFATVTIGGTAYSSFSDLGTFTTLAPPTVQTLAVSPIDKTKATLNAKPSLSGNDTASITFYWGDNDGSNSGSHNQWDHNFTVGGTHNSGDVVTHADYRTDNTARPTMRWPKLQIQSTHLPLARWSHSRRPTAHSPNTQSRASSFGSMPMMSMEMETPIPLETEVRFLHGSTNQPRESPLIRPIQVTNPFTNQHHSGRSQHPI